VAGRAVRGVQSVGRAVRGACRVWGVRTALVCARCVLLADWCMELLPLLCARGITACACCRTQHTPPLRATTARHHDSHHRPSPPPPPP
jgi:hypothetical protein